MALVFSVTKFSLFSLVTASVLFPLEASAASLSRTDVFSKLYVFGDSLSDAGNVFNATTAVSELPLPPGVPVPPILPPDPPYFQGRNSNGPVWVEYLADELNLSLTNSTELSTVFPGVPVFSPITVSTAGPSVSPFFNGVLSTTGVNFAFGGAQTGFQGSTDFGELIPGVLTQVGWFSSDLNLASTTADPDALYVVWAGANDYWGADPGEDTTLLSTTAINNLTAALGQLYDTGARNFLVPNLPDLGLTPRGQISSSENQRLTNVSLSHNSLLTTALDSLSLLPDAEIFSLDAFSLFNQALTSPADFDYDNVSDGCLLVPTCLGNPAVQDSFLFWDDRHPTTSAHEEIANFAFAAVPAPTSVPEPANTSVLGILGGAALLLRQTLKRLSQGKALLPHHKKPRSTCS
ncbi:MAG: SGNH/GDSL hydrolase family protein [Cyanobacteria bacterium P01_D01_bin.156]